LGSDRCREAAVTRVSESRRRNRAAPTTCAELVVELENLVTLAKDKPTDVDVEEKAKEITAAASAVTCTAEEKAQLSEGATGLREAVQVITDVYETLLDAIDLSTGTKPTEDNLGGLTSAPVITEAATTEAAVVTPAAASRKNRLVRDLLMRLNNIN